MKLPSLQTRYRIAVGIFALSSLFMINTVLQIVQKGFTGSITSDFLVQVWVGIGLVVLSSILFIYYSVRIKLPRDDTEAVTLAKAKYDADRIQKHK